MDALGIKIISAGAGSGKTYRLTQEMLSLLEQGNVRAQGIVATTFTRKAAAELQERVRVGLLKKGRSREADELSQALIGTVHGLGVKLLQRFAFEAGVSPSVSIIADEDQQILFNLSLANVLTEERVRLFERLSTALGFNKREPATDWRGFIRQLSDVARANGFSRETLEFSREQSWLSFQPLLGTPINRSGDDWNQRLLEQLEVTIDTLEQNADETAKTKTVVKSLREAQTQLRLHRHLPWYYWARLYKADIGAKSRDDFEPFREFLATHEQHQQLHQDLQQFIDQTFEVTTRALDEYDQYKKRRGLIDYTDMEVLVNELLDQPEVAEVLRSEIDLLLVDEFQDTSPIQLSIFLKLSRLARFSVWVGDPKQSIYGFRGAEPRLMQAVVEQTGGVKPEDIQTYSWRSREELVHACNAIFTRAFSNMPPEQVALIPRRLRRANGDWQQEDEPEGMLPALMHWHFQYDGEGRKPGKAWLDPCIAHSVRELLGQERLIQDRETGVYRPLKPSDVAVLCRSNRECQQMAEELHKQGIKAAIARGGLLQTKEARLVLACLKLLVSKSDSLALAEILLLAEQQSLEQIIENRLDYLDYLESLEDSRAEYRWGREFASIDLLNELRTQVVELSSAELLDLVLEALDIRRIAASWGNTEQRLNNLERLGAMARQYEEACNRLHTAASLGGFLLWLDEQEQRGADEQGSGADELAVHVLTYHKSKGLEYPLTVCHSLETTLRGDVWGLQLVSESEEVNLNDVLAKRWIRLWVNPYSDQVKNTPLDQRIQESEAQAQATRNALDEEARLLYVGLTRARDYLVLPSRAGGDTGWLNRVFNEGHSDRPTLDPHSNDTPWIWNERILPIDTRCVLLPKDIPGAEPKVEQVSYLAPRAGESSAHRPYRIQVAELDAPALSIRQLDQYGPALEASDDMDAGKLSTAIKLLVQADGLHRSESERLEQAQGILHRLELDEQLEADKLARHSQAFHQWLQQTWNPRRIQRQVPLHTHFEGQLFETEIDLLLEDESGQHWIVQHSNNRRRVGAQAKVQELNGWFHLAQMALSEALGGKSVGLALHLLAQAQGLRLGS